VILFYHLILYSSCIAVTELYSEEHLVCYIVCLCMLLYKVPCC